MSDAVQLIAAVVLGIAFLAVFGTALAVVVVRLFSRSTSIEILRERYARGEIDAAAYDEMRKRLKD
jgi:uncharacterized membrane protein